MALSKEIKDKIEELSHTKKHEEITIFLIEQFKNNTVNAQDVYNYSERFYWPNKQEKPYVINAKTINLLGVAVAAIKDKNQAKLAINFYYLAATRGSSWGNVNYARRLLNGQANIESPPQKPLVYANKAVELAKNRPDEKDVHKLTLYHALRQENEWIKANNALTEYFSYQHVQKNEDAIKSAMIAFQKSIDEFLTDSKDKTNILAELQPILDCKVSSNEFLPIKQKAYFIVAKHYETIGNLKKAWSYYCLVTDKKLIFFVEAVASRVRLLESIIENPLVLPVNAQANTQENDLMLPQGIPLPSRFIEYWKDEASWFNSLNEAGLKSEYEKRSEQIEKLITGKEQEIALFLESKPITEQLQQQQKNAEQELAKLETVKETLDEKHTQHSSTYRSTYRRHMAEKNFFNPKRSNKQQELSSLTKNIFEHRYNTQDTGVMPVNLNGKSTRLVITAERLFQESVVHLNESEPLKLGIPITREKQWEMDFGYNTQSGKLGYGPVEHYRAGQTVVKSEHRTDPKRQRLGDSFLPEHGSYSSDIYHLLIRLSNNETSKEKQLAQLMIRYGKTHQTVTIEELKVLYDEIDEEDTQSFNRICFLIMEKEQAQWHSSTDESYQLGMSVSHARCLIMIEAGFISFTEAFKNDVLFGIYSQTGIVQKPEKVAKACTRIDELYLVYLQHKNPTEHFAFLKKYQSETRACILTRKQAHQDLRYVHGGESDADDEGYDSDLSMKL
ncbi:MAG: hypothetical protein WC748_09475 [Legionellales bacterium]|jgi:hypothetical protein